MIVLVILIALILRFWHLGAVPLGLDWDEVSNAYNGYSILKTGRDEFGQSFSILFRAYDGFVPPVLIYLNAVTAAIFGLSESASRLTNAILGVIAIPGVYLLVKEISDNKRLSLFSALFLAIMPWHIFYSRINILPSVPIVFTVYGAFFFFLGIRRLKFLLISSLLFILAIFSYFSAYVFTPLFALLLTLIYFSKLGLSKTVIFTAPIVISSILILTVLPGSMNRFQGVSVFSDPDLIKVETLEAENEGSLGKIVHNRRLVYIEKFLEGYLAYFRLDFLFGKGDAQDRMVVDGFGFGLMYLWSLPFLLVGIYYLVNRRPSGFQLFLGWLLLAPIPAAVALPQPSSTRVTLLMPALAIICAYGFYQLLKRSTILARFFLILLILNFLLFTHQYFDHFPSEKAPNWFWGYRPLFDSLTGKDYVHKKVYFLFSQHDSLDQIHMFLLFYNKVDPAAWQQNGGTRLGCLGTTAQFTFDRYTFIPYSCLDKPFDFSQIISSGIIVTSRAINDNYDIRINFPDGSGAFYVYEFENVGKDIERFTSKNN